MESKNIKMLDKIVDTSLRVTFLLAHLHVHVVIIRVPVLELLLERNEP